MARTLINEVWEVVDQNYLDARHTGFDAAKWAALRDAALRGTYGSSAQGYRAIRQMLADGISDPYCRFITPTELAVMKKYDVTGVGLNLGTADEYVRKTGRQLARGTGQLASSDGGEEARRCPLCCLDVCGLPPLASIRLCVCPLEYSMHERHLYASPRSCSVAGCSWSVSAETVSTLPYSPVP